MAALSVVSLLSLLQLSNASPYLVGRHDPPPLPGNFTAQGCFVDSISSRTLSGATFTSTDNMTTEACIAFCEADNFVFAGTEFGQECYCGNFTAPTTAIANDTDCSIPCTGNDLEICGGEFRLNVFWDGVIPPTPVIVPAVGDWVSLGCFSDDVDGRALPIGPMSLDVPNTIEACTAECFSQGYPLAGAEFSAECFCGTAIINGGAPAAATDCDMVCTGNATEFCGGSNRLNVYNFTGTGLPPIVGGGDGSGGTPPPNPPTPVPVLTGLPSTWAYQGCFVDSAFGRVFEFGQPESAENTVESCIATCDSQNFTVAGTEFSDQCFCGDRLVNGAVIANETDCSMACAGNATEACGGPNRLSVYSSTPNITLVPVPTPATTGLPEGWAYDGCFSDNGGNNGRALPLQIILSSDNSAVNCIDACIAANPNVTAAGMEFGDECYCGTIADITTNNSTETAATDCNVACSGDPASLCGGGFRLQMYTLSETGAGAGGH